jgi:conjugal transfer pilus assembly protein TraF
MIKLISCFVLILISNVSQASFEKKPQGFLWYNERLQKEKTKKDDQALAKNENKQQKEIADWDRRIEDLKERFNVAERRAIDNPTIGNVIVAQRLQKEIMDKSEQFANMWQLAVLLDHELSNNEEHSNILHRKISEQTKKQKNDDKLKNIARSWGLILQFDNDCPHCHAFAPIVREFAETFGFQVLAVSIGGNDFAGIAGIRDTGFIASSGLNPNREVPVLYLMSSNGALIYPIARGINNVGQIAANILAIDQNYRKLGAASD